MRHHVAGRKLSRHSKHRELMFRNMLASLITHGRIKTTEAKAKELRRWADKIITVAKKGTLHARRQAFALLRDETMVKKLFDEIAPRFKDRMGGYTRIYKIQWRVGDAAPLALIEYVGSGEPEKKKKSLVKKAKASLKKEAPKGKAEKKESKEKKPKAVKLEVKEKESKESAAKTKATRIKKEKEEKK